MKIVINMEKEDDVEKLIGLLALLHGDDLDYTVEVLGEFEI